MSEQRLFLDDIYNNENCGSSVFRAVVMMSKEARFLNEQSKMGFIELHMKPTTLAMKKFQEKKLEYTESEVENENIPIQNELD